MALAGGATAKKDAAAVAATTTTAVPVPPATCPLTGTPAPGNVVPARPALATKIGDGIDVSTWVIAARHPD